MDYTQKYLKYKNKYLDLKQMFGGTELYKDAVANSDIDVVSEEEISILQKYLDGVNFYISQNKFKWSLTKDSIEITPSLSKSIYNALENMCVSFKTKQHNAPEEAIKPGQCSKRFSPTYLRNDTITHIFNVLVKDMSIHSELRGVGEDEGLIDFQPISVNMINHALAYLNKKRRGEIK
jgi:hypothetical protein